MDNRPLRSLRSPLSLAAAIGALAIVFMLTVIASQAAQAQTYNVIHNFTGGADGRNPFSGLTIDAAGNLYGTAVGGDPNYCKPDGCGTVYQLKRKASGWTFNLLYSFTGGNDGANPQGGVIFGPDGLLYGTTVSGGDTNCEPYEGCGTIFNLRPSPRACKSALCPSTETVLYRFHGSPSDGDQPGWGDLIFDQKGNLYGTTFVGGAYGEGTVYEFTPSGSGGTEVVLLSFDSYPRGGLHPFSGVILDSAGNLYGTTYDGGEFNDGTVYQLTPSGSGWTAQNIYEFSNGTDGRNPYAGLIIDQFRNLYGATPFGGSDGGTAFKLTPSNGSWTYSLVYGFTGGIPLDGCGPQAALVMDAAGNLYGTTTCDGKNQYGNVFKLTKTSNGWTYKSLHDFTGSDGVYPYSNVIFDSAGNLYGTTNVGGSHGYGVVWEITP